MKKKSELKQLLLLVCMMAVAFIFLVPIIWMVSASFQGQGQIFKVPFNWIPREEQGRIDGIETEKQKRNTVCRQRTPADLDHLYIAFRELGDDGRGTERHSQPEDRAEDSCEHRKSQQEIAPDEVQADSRLGATRSNCVYSQYRHHGQQNTQYDI